MKNMLKASVLSLGVMFSSAHAAVSITCEDSDGGKNAQIEGSITVKVLKNSELLREVNFADRFIRQRGKYAEFYCDGNRPAYELLDCNDDLTLGFCPKNTAASKVSMNVTETQTVFSDLIVANLADKEILNFQFNSNGETILLSGVNFYNALDNITPEEMTSAAIAGAEAYTYKLYDKQSSTLLATATAQAGQVNFVLDAPLNFNGLKDLSVRVDAKNFTEASQTWQRLRLKLNKTNSVVATTQSGGSVEAVYATQMGSWPISEEMVNVRSQFSLRHAQTQPVFVDPSMNEQEVYRFTLTADAAGDVKVRRMQLEAAVSGMKFESLPTANVYLVKSDGTTDYANSNLGTIRFVADENSVTDGKIIVRFNNMVLGAGESKTFALALNNLVNDAAQNSDDDAILIKITTDRFMGTVGAESDPQGPIWWTDFPGTDNSFKRGFMLDLDFGSKINQD